MFTKSSLQNHNRLHSSTSSSPPVQSSRRLLCLLLSPSHHHRDPKMEAPGSKSSPLTPERSLPQPRLQLQLPALPQQLQLPDQPRSTAPLPLQAQRNQSSATSVNTQRRLSCAAQQQQHEPPRSSLPAARSACAPRSSGLCQ